MGLNSQKTLGQLITLVLLTTLLTPLITSPASAAAPKPGSSCAKLWQVKVFKSVRHTCVRVNKKLVWNRGVSIARPKPKPTATATATPRPTPVATPTSTPIPTPIPTPTPTPTQPAVTTPKLTSLPIYRGGPGAVGTSSNLVRTPELSFVPAAPAAGVNLKLFVHLPENPATSLRSPGVWVKSPQQDWQFWGSRLDGTVFLTLSAGTYLIDTVEPDGLTFEFKRKMYDVLIEADGTPKIVGVLPNSAGFFGLTIDRVDRTANEFTPANQCQLLGQDGNLNLNQGFPARAERLPRQGTIRALIVPVDFADVPANDRPETAFFEMANLTDEFYQKMSGGAVSFSFQVLPNYVRMPFLSTFHNLGSWSGGDAAGYWRAALRAADPFVDYSQFDVVYVLSPKTIPFSSIAYGPAFPSRTLTDDGYVKNGTFSGADAYQAIPGAGWKWMAHETGHLFGLHDLYTIAPQRPTFGDWDLMSNNWSVKAIELSSWNRFLMGWMPPGSYECIVPSAVRTRGSSITLLPIASVGPGVKSIMIPINSAEILVMEYRTTAGLDVVPSNESGLLVYTVSMTIPTIRGGWQVVRPARSTSPNFVDAALQVGESVSIAGFTITLNSQLGQGLVVSIR